MGGLLMTDTFTYYSATEVTVSGDRTSVYLPGQLLKFVQNSVTKYFIIYSATYSSPNTYISLNGGGIFTLENATITSPQKTTNLHPSDIPYGFPYSYIKRSITEVASNVYGRRATFSLSPASTPSDCYYYGDYVDIGNTTGDTNTYEGIVGGSYNVTLKAGSTASTALDGIIGNVSSFGSSPATKGVVGAVSNYGTVAGFGYGGEFYVHNWANSGGTGDMDVARGVRTRLQNTTQNASATGEANMDLAQAFYASAYNGASGTVGYHATITRLVGFEYDLNNDVGGYIGAHAAISITTPTNNGTIDYNYGLYIADQSAVGTTAAYGIYCNGKSRFVGVIETTRPIKAPGIAVNPDTYSGQSLFCIGSNWNLYKWNGSSWTNLGGTCRYITVKSPTEVYVVGDDECVWKWTYPDTWTSITTAVP
jgi:hypothetical protein